MMSFNKDFDAVKMTREIRDRMSEEMKGMTIEEQIEYIRRKSGLRKVEEKQEVVVSEKK